MQPLLVRVPPDAAVPPAQPGDLVGLVPVTDYRAGEEVVAILPGGRALAGLTLQLQGVWWLLTDAAIDGCALRELVALSPSIELVRLLLFRPI